MRRFRRCCMVSMLFGPGSCIAGAGCIPICCLLHILRDSGLFCICCHRPSSQKRHEHKPYHQHADCFREPGCALRRAAPPACRSYRCVHVFESAVSPIHSKMLPSPGTCTWCLCARRKEHMTRKSALPLHEAARELKRNGATRCCRNRRPRRLSWQP